MGSGRGDHDHVGIFFETTESKRETAVSGGIFYCRQENARQMIDALILAHPRLRENECDF